MQSGRGIDEAETPLTPPPGLRVFLFADGDVDAALRDELFRECGRLMLTEFNDTSTHAQVLRLIDRTIAVVESNSTEEST